MSYKLEKPCTDVLRADFIVKYNHNQNLQIIETEDAIFALLDNEIMRNGIPTINENYTTEIARKRQDLFNKDFFSTSIGWIRRKVKMVDGSTKDFLSDMLLPIKAGLEMGQEVEIITYKEPNFEHDLTEEYIISLQERKKADLDFIKECLNQTVIDFAGG